ncbi:MAG: hypothetical protein EBZ48_16270, partial [Proteobacteria bacterium]|nr:hypothetical protein [Pseudomonadota bacterium]
MRRRLGTKDPDHLFDPVDHAGTRDGTHEKRRNSGVHGRIDEVADVKSDTWEKVLRAALSDKKGKALFIGTPKGRNWFYDMYNLGTSEEDEEWKSWHFTTKDNPLIDPKEIEGAKKTLSSFAFKQEYEASFDNAGTDLFKEEWIKY